MLQGLLNHHNKINVKNRYLLLMIDVLLDQLQYAQFLTKLDVKWYHQVRIKEEDTRKIALEMKQGLLE